MHESMTAAIPSPIAAPHRAHPGPAYVGDSESGTMGLAARVRARLRDTVERRGRGSGGIHMPRDHAGEGSARPRMHHRRADVACSGNEDDQREALVGGARRPEAPRAGYEVSPGGGAIIRKPPGMPRSNGAVEIERVNRALWPRSAGGALPGWRPWEVVRLRCYCVMMAQAIRAPELPAGSVV